MSDFATDTFARIQTRINAMQEFGPAPLFAFIAGVLQDNEWLAGAMLAEATSIHGAESFIVEGETTSNQVFLEIVRRVAFIPFSETPNVEVSMRRTVVTYMATELTTFLNEFERQNGQFVFARMGEGRGGQ